MICFCRRGTSAAPISTPRSPRAIITASDDVEDRLELVDGLLQLDLGDHPCLRTGGLDPRLERRDVQVRADERQRDVVHAESECEVEIREVLLGQRGDRKRDARDVDPLVGLDDTSGHDLAQSPLVLDSLDT